MLSGLVMPTTRAARRFPRELRGTTIAEASPASDAGAAVAAPVMSPLERRSAG